MPRSDAGARRKTQSSKGFHIRGSPMTRIVVRLCHVAAVLLVLLCQVASAQERVIKVAVLKVPTNAHFLHYAQLAPKGYKFEAFLVNTPGDAKDAIVTGSADFGLAGVAAAVLGNANGEPVVIVANLVGGSMAVIAKADSPIQT
ncbi:MAG: ABC transporter substrate-binding protein [Pseudomonadota bacterium]